MNETARIGHVSSSAAGQGQTAWQPQSGRQSVGRSWRAPTAIDSNRNNTLSAFSVSQCCPLEPRGGNRLSLLLHALRVAKQAGNRSFRYSVLIGSCHLACRGTLVTHPLGPCPTLLLPATAPSSSSLLMPRTGRETRLAVVCASLVRAYFRVQMMRR